MYEIGMFLEMHFKRRFKPYVQGEHCHTVAIRPTTKFDLNILVLWLVQFRANEIGPILFTKVLKICIISRFFAV